MRSVLYMWRYRFGIFNRGPAICSFLAVKVSLLKLADNDCVLNGCSFVTDGSFETDQAHPLTDPLCVLILFKDLSFET